MQSTRISEKYVIVYLPTDKDVCNAQGVVFYGKSIIQQSDYIFTKYFGH